MGIEKRVATVYEVYKEDESKSVALLSEFFPVALGTRPAARLYLAEMLLDLVDPEAPLTEQERKLPEREITELAEFLGLVPIGGPYEDCFLARKGSEAEAKIRSFRDKKVTNIDFGVVLGYPTCCTQEFHKNKMEDPDNIPWLPDLKGQKQIREMRQNGSQLNPLAYFTRNFVPCVPNCEAAIAIGQRVLSGYEKLSRQLETSYRKLTEFFVDDLEIRDFKPYERALQREKQARV